MPKVEIRTKPYDYCIGIDCGVNTGIACWRSCNTKGLCWIQTVPIHRAMRMIEIYLGNYNIDRLLVRVEDARLRKWIPRQKNEKAEKGLREGAGSVKRDAKIWEDFLEDLGLDYELVPPKNNKTKVSAEYFKSLTGFEGKTTEHGRDACMLVFGL